MDYSWQDIVALTVVAGAVALLVRSLRGAWRKRRGGDASAGCSGCCSSCTAQREPPAAVSLDVRRRP